jgi:DNA-directed RNA polymerase alpha subunit
MTELGRFAARPWTQADDDKLRALALAGASTRAIRAAAGSDDNCSRVTSETAEHRLEKSEKETLADVLKGEEDMNKRSLLDPTPEMPDDTLIEDLRFATRIRNALAAAGLKTVGEIREASDATLLSLQDLGPGSVAHLRETLGLPSRDGVRPR